ncbi:MAG: CBS domain-containing protein [Erysipelotrichaceae bacterium]|nr:CBS domain-containing protein [Erysipelotrichaceae bacterium]
MKSIAKNIMSKNVISILPSTTVQEAAIIMKKYDIGFLPIIENHNILGVITDRDIVIRAAISNDLNKTINNFMTPSPLQFVTEDTSISDVIFTMANYKIRRVLVLNENNHLSGIISLKDVILYSVENINNIANIFTETHFRNL